MKRAITQAALNTFYLNHRYDPAYQYKYQDVNGEIHIGFDLVKLLESHGFPLLLKNLSLRHLDFSYSNLIGMRIVKCDLSFARFEGINQATFQRCRTFQTLLPMQETTRARDVEKDEMLSIRMDCLDLISQVLPADF